MQSLVKNFEMEMFHKISVDDFRTIDVNKYTFSLNGMKYSIRNCIPNVLSPLIIICCLIKLMINKTKKISGRKPLTAKEVGKLGGYNPFLQTSLPEEYRYYNAENETAESSHRAFTATLPRGFALEIIEVYSGPPNVVLKFRHWGYMEGPFKSHAPTGEKVEFYGVAIFKVGIEWIQLQFLLVCCFFGLFLFTFLMNQLDEKDKIVGVEFFFDPAELLGQLMKGPGLDGSAEKAVSSCPVLRNTG